MTDESLGLIVLAHVAPDTPGTEALAEAFRTRGLATQLVNLARAGDDLGSRADALAEILDRDLAEHLPVGLYGSGAGAAPALMAAAARPGTVRAVVTHDAHPDLAGPALTEVLAPTLFLAVEADVDVNEEARTQMQAHNELRVVTTAHHLIAEPGELEQIADLAGQWFADWFSSPE